MQRSEIIAQVRKLRMMAADSRTPQTERDNAKGAADRLMRKHGLTQFDLLDFDDVKHPTAAQLDQAAADAINKVVDLTDKVTLDLQRKAMGFVFDGLESVLLGKKKR